MQDIIDGTYEAGETRFVAANMLILGQWPWHRFGPNVDQQRTHSCLFKSSRNGSTLKPNPRRFLAFGCKTNDDKGRPSQFTDYGSEPGFPRLKRFVRVPDG